MTNARNLNESRAEALQALDRVSDRLGEILGEAPEDGTHRNEYGELVNEEGLPIIDITEPLDDLDTPSLSAATEDEVIGEDNYPEPISQLSPEALAISKKHRDKILDLLEEEETREERRTRQEQQAELLRKRDAARNEMQKRMESQGAQLEKRRRAKELERKMAKALVGGLEDSKPKSQNKENTDRKEKKSVTFAEAPSTFDATRSRSEVHGKGPTWGDIVAGRLTGKQRFASRSRTQPMKMEVTERLSGLSQPPSDSNPSLPGLLGHEDQIGDSDDESDAEAHSDSTLAFESGEEDVVLSAHHHRELALEYHRRREALASGVGDIKPEEINLGVSVDAKDWESENVPFEATLAHAPPKPSVSKFKAESAKSGSKDLGPAHETRPLASTFGTAALPPGALTKSIKMGKLVDGNLVAGYEEDKEDDREAREEEEIRKLLLQSIENYSDIAAQMMGPTGSYWAESKAQGTDPNAQQVKRKPKVSRFKVNRSQSRDTSEFTTTLSEPSQSSLKKIDPSGRPKSTTPPSNAGSSCTKPTQREGPAMKHAQVASPDMSRKTVINSPSFVPKYISPLRSTSTSNIITNSPSFRNHATSSPSGPIPTVIESPSFAPPASVIESPLFMRPQLTESQPRHARNSVSAEQPRNSEREPGTMANNVIERSTNRNSSVTAGVTKSQRISRFKAGRGSQ